MKDAGSALMGIGRASGEDRAAEAAREAIASPLLEVNIAGAQGVLFNITGGPSLGLFEVDEAAEIISETADSGGEHHLRHGHRRAHGRRRLDHRHRHRLRRLAQARRRPRTETVQTVASGLAAGRDNRDFLKELELAADDP